MTSAINYSAVNTLYPIPGRDNNSQGLRDNFSAIKDGLQVAKSEISDLQAIKADLSTDNYFDSITASTSPATGAIAVAGGVGIAGDLYVGGNIRAGTAKSLIPTTSTIASLVSAAVTSQITAAIVPIGSIMLWYGAANAIPTGWALCNGSTVNGYVTPDLRNKFVMGAGDTYAVNATGGFTDIPVISHSHTLTDPGHQHGYTVDNPAGTGSPASTDTTPGEAANQIAGYTSTVSTGITISTAVGGISGTGRNLPPFKALCYIMKVA